MPKESGHDAENLNVKGQRRGLFSLLSHVLVTSQTKFDMEKAANSDRQKWARIIIAGVQAYGDLLKTVELDDIEKRLDVLESESNEKALMERMR